MKTISAFLFALVLASGAAMAQGTGGGAGGGTGGAAGGTAGSGSGSGDAAQGQSSNQPGPSGTNLGKDASANPTAAECARGWNSTMSMSKSAFDMKCKDR